MKCVIDTSGLRGRESDRNTKSAAAPESHQVWLRTQRKKQQQGSGKK